MQQVEIIISGRVQGVGFRQFTADRARAHGVRGWVRNRGDGSVHVTAAGDDRAVDAFLGDLRSGPPLARVDDVDVRRGNPSGEFEGFRIRH